MTANASIPDAPRRGPLYGTLALLAAGLGVALYLVDHKLRISLDPDYESACNLSSAVNCDAVNTSAWSDIAGIPIALLAIPTYVVMAFLVWRALRATRAADDEARRAGWTAVSAIYGIGLLTSFYSAYLFYRSTVDIGSICLFCIGLYVVNVGTAVLAWLAGGRRAVAMIREAFACLTPPRGVALGAIAVLVAAGGAAYGWYSLQKSGLEDDYKARIDAQFAEAGAAAEAPAPTPEPVAAPEPAANTQDTTAAAAPSGRGPQVDPSQARGSGQRTKDGWTLFDVPLDVPNEFWFGNPDAKVTVVKFADFQCGYCRFLSTTMKPVMAKYKDRVRFVMKNFPMNFECNRAMRGYDKHPYACVSAYAGICAGLQGRFWEMHDAMYANQKALDPASLRGYAEELGLDMAKYDACLTDPNTERIVKDEVEIGLRAGLRGTPRTYIGGRMVPGSASKAILEYYIDKALERADGAAAAAPDAPAAAPKPGAGAMVATEIGDRTVYIDAYEAALTKDGRAVTLPGVEPAQASWFTAKAACEAAGKRLCTEQEWVSACAGAEAVDNNNNGFFADDTVEGNMYPYGAFYEARVCNDSGDKYEGRPQPTGSNARCRTPAGVFDLGGNIGEWVGVEKARAALVGGHVSSGTRAACNQRSAGSGVGKTNHTTGFRCCADTLVEQAAVDPEALRKNEDDLVDKAVPAFEVQDSAGATIDSARFRGKVTLVNFFASWCGPCKKEFPYLVHHQQKLGAKGFQVVAIGVDGQAQRSLDFAAKYEPNFPIVTDPDSKLMGLFRVYSMPATFLVDREGVIRYADTGFKPEVQAAKLEKAILDLL